ncbi:MAG: haloacid dehalogenase-like hydrolase [Candidatus Eisenbacteria bacterium]
MKSDETTPAPDGSGVVLLFDIDGTLLDARGAGRRALERAVEEWSGRSLGSFRVHLGGRTDLDIFRELVGELGIPYPAPPERRQVLRRYLELLARELERTPPWVHPGVSELALRPEFHHGLVTGNVRPGAELKLAAAGLGGRFSFGAYGSDHEDRNLLVPLALHRLWRRHGPKVPPARTVVIGDTEKDIECARAAGSKVLLVGTGFGDYAKLAPEADAALPDLGNVDLVLETLARLTES